MTPFLFMFINQEDFVGDIEITQSANITDKLNSIIETVEKNILRLLLGDDLYILFLADLDGNNEPQTTNYINLLNGINFDYGERKYIYDGLKLMLKYFIYSEYIKYNSLQATVGTVIPEKDNSITMSDFDISELSNKAYNKGIKYYREAISYIVINIEDYSTFDYTFLAFKFNFGIV